MPNPTCTRPDCTKPARSATAELCPMHYHRLYRHGDVNADMRTIKTGTPRTYRRVRAKGHPLADKSGGVYEHRFVLFEEIGEGPHDCNWCGRSLDWHAPKGDRGSLTVDHLNGDKADNRLENLVPSCPPCNGARAQGDRRKALAQFGAWSRNDTVAGLKSPTQRRRTPFPVEHLASTYRAS